MLTDDEITKTVVKVDFGAKITLVFVYLIVEIIVAAMLLVTHVFVVVSDFVVGFII